MERYHENQSVASWPLLLTSGAKLLAAILSEPRRFELQEQPRPKFGPQEVLVRIKVCGICTSELDMWEGKATALDFPRFIGHEVVGVVEAVGNHVTSVAEGDHVAVWSEGKGYAEYQAVDEKYLVKLEKSTPFAYALGEPIACAVNGVRKADIQLNDSVCIVGCGFMGLLMLQILKLRGAGLVIGVDTRKHNLELAMRLGASHALNPKERDIRRAIQDLTDGRGVDLGVEAAGSQATLDLTTQVVRKEGKLEVFGFHQSGPRTVDWGYWNWMAFEIINGHVRASQVYIEGMRTGLQLLESGRLILEPLITHSFPLEQINQGFEMASSKQEGFVKGVIVI